MKVLIVGSGGREHALARKVRESPLVTEVFAAPGNAGMAAEATLVPIAASEVVRLAQFAAEVGIDLTVVGPEAPLFLGIRALFEERGLDIVAPSQAAAEIEGSKIFAKKFMDRHAIPTARYWVAESATQASQLLDDGQVPLPVVVKADGLAQGKGVVIARTREEAKAAVQTMMVERRFGSAGDRLLLEECLEGPEVSAFVLTDGKTLCPLVPAQDHKRLLDGDRGPNTGGMGAYSPVVSLDGATYQGILRDIVLKTVNGMALEGREFRGVLFVGLMLTASGPRVIEFNARLGDPEAQTILARLKSDIVPVLRALAAGQLGSEKLEWRKEAAVTVVLASQGYPGDPLRGKPITGLDEAAAMAGVTVSHAATQKGDGGFVTAGGRVLGVTAIAPSLARAVESAYAACDVIRFEGKIHRRDIAQRGIDHLRKES